MTHIVDATADPPLSSVLEVALDVLSSGAPIVLPTDTVYGVGVDPSRPGAVDRLFALKRRPRDLVLAVLVADAEQAAELVEVDATGAQALMDRFWPGQLTIVLPRRSGVLLDLGNSSATIGVRCPAHVIPRALAARLGPLATSSANRHGDPTPLTAAEAAASLGPDLVLALDGGPCAGLASTVVELAGDELRILRLGGLDEATLRAAFA